MITRKTRAQTQNEALANALESMPGRRRGDTPSFLADKLRKCADSPNRRCELNRICQRCNSRAQSRTWSRSKRDQVVLFLHAQATPVHMRISAPLGPSLASGYATLQSILDSFLFPFRSRYSGRNTDPLSQSVLSLTTGLHLARKDNNYHVHAHLLVWIRPGNPQQVKWAMELLALHLNHCTRDHRDGFLEEVKGRQNQGLKDAIRTFLRYTTKLWEVTNPQDVVDAYKIIHGKRTVSTVGMRTKGVTVEQIALLSVTEADVLSFRSGILASKPRSKSTRKRHAPPPPRPRIGYTQTDVTNPASKPPTPIFMPRSPGVAARPSGRVDAVRPRFGQGHTVPVSGNTWAAVLQSFAEELEINPPD